MLHLRTNVGDTLTTVHTSGVDTEYQLVPYTGRGQLSFTLEQGIVFPSAAYFHNQETNKEVCYVAVRHANSADHPSCKLIKEVFNDYKPNCFVLEGFENSPKMIKYYKEEDKNFDPKKCNNEVSYAVQLACKNDIPFIGAEPSDNFLETELEKLDYQAADISYCGFINSIPQAVREGKNYETIKEYFSSYYTGGESGSELFESHYEYRTGKKASLAWFKTSECSAPLEEGDYFQKLTLAKSDLRNLNILKTIKAATEKYNRVMVIYGCSHYFQQYKVLFKEYGIPTYKEQSFWYRYSTHANSILRHIFQ